jgi:CubicO group peptidase (beta-lactamase class C family)
VADPAEHGLDPAQVAAGVREIAAQPGVRTLLVVAGGELVVEEAWGGASTRQPSNLMSASKSMLSALVGVALDEGALSGLDATVAELLPRALPEDAGGKRSITLRHLLTQTSGLASTSGEHYGAWVSTGDWSRAALARPLLEPPGEEFRYSTGNTHLVAAMLAAAAGEDLLAYARRELLDPLGIGAVAWDESPEGVRFGGNGLAMTPRDAARFGLLYLQGGHWGGAQVVPADWVESSTRVQTRTPPEWAQRYGDYGYLWWVPRGPGGDFTAVGYGGQFVHVAPRAGVVVVLTSTIESKGAQWDRRVLGIVRDRFAGG